MVDKGSIVRQWRIWPCLIIVAKPPFFRAIYAALVLINYLNYFIISKLGMEARVGIEQRKELRYKGM